MMQDQMPNDQVMENVNTVDDADDFYYNGQGENTVEQPQIVIPNIELPQMGDIAPVEPMIQEVGQETVADTIPSFTTEEPVETISEEKTSQEDVNEAPIENIEENEVPIVEDSPVDNSFLDTMPSFEPISFDTNSSLETTGSFDSMFDSLYNDVNGANNFISDMLTQKKRIQDYEANLKKTKEKLDKEREDFANYIEAQRKIIETEKEQCNDYVKNQRLRIQNSEQKFNSDCEATKAELKLEEEKIKQGQLELEQQKEQFNKTKTLEEEKIQTERQKLETEKEQFAKDQEIALEKIKQGQQELEQQKEQFAKTKELEEKKLELESKNLSQSCARFKELVSQLNSGFQQLPGDRN